jgi:hypothetical protein
MKTHSQANYEHLMAELERLRAELETLSDQCLKAAEQAHPGILERISRLERQVEITRALAVKAATESNWLV